VRPTRFSTALVTHTHAQKAKQQKAKQQEDCGAGAGSTDSGGGEDDEEEDFESWWLEAHNECVDLRAQLEAVKAEQETLRKETIATIKELQASEASKSRSETAEVMQPAPAPQTLRAAVEAVLAHIEDAGVWLDTASESETARFRLVLRIYCERALTVLVP
jgi:hypothetical protein